VDFRRGMEVEFVSHFSYTFGDVVWIVVFSSEFVVRLGREGPLSVCLAS